ncbi:MAG TPA: helix-turn-helix transcriptional regulator [Thermoanaerobaculia bacterium]|nr:helix-turn-helix transcriptional regulator [Thermoanaerobaculia bacterium]
MRQLLREAAEALLAAGWTKRDLERRLHVGSGNLDKRLNGEGKLTLDYLMDFAAVLDIPPSQLLLLAYPEVEAGARRNLSDWIARRTPVERRAALAALPATRVELENLLRSVVRDELDRRRPSGGPQPAPQPANGSSPSSIDELPSWIDSFRRLFGRSSS